MNVLKNYKVGILLIVLALFIVGCSTKTTTPPVSQPVNTVTPPPQVEDSKPIISEPDPDILGPKYRGTVLAGEKTPYIEFNMEDYGDAIVSGKIILLYFYSLQSAPSIADQATVHSAFNEMTNPNIIGFRVNIDDDNTDASEDKLASDLGVETAGEKVILKNGAILQQTSKSWNANDYIRQITQYLDK
ncbi:MAG: hypothetical protein ACP5OA_01115 [Candidatus Woesearchaeota archaeon]